MAAACLVSPALFIFAVIATAPAAHEGGLPPVITGDVDMLCVPNPPNDLTFTCSVNSTDTVSTDVHWILGDYQVVDQVEFRDYGVVITPEEAEMARTTMRLIVPEDSMNAKSTHGTTFLFDNSVDAAFPEARNTPVTISCVSVQNDLNIMRADPITLYRVAPPVEEPEVEVTGCNDDMEGTLNISITYQRIPDNEICSTNDEVNNAVYSLSLSSGGMFNFSANEDLVAVFDGVSVTADLTAKMTFRVGENSLDTFTVLSGVTCNAAYIDLCNDSMLQQVGLECGDLTNSSDGWSCQYASGITVADVYKDQVYEQSRALDMSLSGTENCSELSDGGGGNGGGSNKARSDDDCNEGLAIGLPVVVGVVTGFAPVFVLLLFIGLCRKHQICCFSKSD